MKKSILKSLMFWMILGCSQVFGVTAEGLALFDKLTIITTTSPIPSNPSTEMLEKSHQSLLQTPGLRDCRHIIVFDGVPPHLIHLTAAYEQYIRNVQELANTHPDFANTTLVVNKEFKHLSNSLREAVNTVQTPYMFVHQHDFFVVRPIDMVNLIRSMDSNPNLKHIRLNQYANTANWFDGPVDDYVEGGSYVPLTRCFGWSDNDHITRLDYYQNFVFPRVPWGAMEWYLHNQAVILQDHLSYGTYVYGGLGDPILITHLDGKTFVSKK